MFPLECGGLLPRAGLLVLSCPSEGAPLLLSNPLCGPPILFSPHPHPSPRHPEERSGERSLFDLRSCLSTQISHPEAAQFAGEGSHACVVAHSSRATLHCSQPVIAVGFSLFSSPKLCTVNCQPSTVNSSTSSPRSSFPRASPAAPPKTP